MLVSWLHVGNQHGGPSSWISKQQLEIGCSGGSGCRHAVGIYALLSKSPNEAVITVDPGKAGGR